MKALVTTPQFLLFVDVDRRAVTPLETVNGEYYGISWFPGSRDIVTSHSGIDNRRLVGLEDYASSELGWIASAGWRTEPFLSQPHQLLCASDGRVVCTNTGRNCLTILDPRQPGQWQEARLSPPRWDRLSSGEQAGDHLNSVFERDGRLYVLAHGFQKGSFVATFAYPEMRLLAREPVPGRTGLHNVWVTRDGHRIGCHSDGGAVVDLATGEVLWEAGVPTYTRGLAASGDVVLVGDSEPDSRADRRHSTSGLWVLDRRNWRTMDYLCLGQFGVVHEIRLLDCPDDAHHGHPLADPDRLLADDLWARRARERLAGSAAAAAGRLAWSGYDLAFGAPEFDPRGFRIATGTDLCLMLRSAAVAERDIAFDYELRPGSASHIAAVCRYRGAGGDTDMWAFLLLLAGEGATATIWRQDGKGWSEAPGERQAGLPARGRAALRPHAGGYQFTVDGMPLLALPESADRGRMGIRWFNAAVRPAREPGPEGG
jgi:hypothetical protein